jgi:hypothetical protein
MGRLRRFATLLHRRKCGGRLNAVAAVGVTEQLLLSGLLRTVGGLVSVKQLPILRRLPP